MSIIQMYKTIDSETLILPELRQFIGKKVHITIIDETTTGFASEEAWDHALAMTRNLKDYDFSAQLEQDQIDIQDMKSR